MKKSTIAFTILIVVTVGILFGLMEANIAYVKYHDKRIIVKDKPHLIILDGVVIDNIDYDIEPFEDPISKDSIYLSPIYNHSEILPSRTVPASPYGYKLNQEDVK